MAMNAALTPLFLKHHKAMQCQKAWPHRVRSFCCPQTCMCTHRHVRVDLIIQKPHQDVITPSKQTLLRSNVHAPTQTCKDDSWVGLSSLRSLPFILLDQPELLSRVSCAEPGLRQMRGEVPAKRHCPLFVNCFRTQIGRTGTHPGCTVHDSTQRNEESVWHTSDWGSIFGGQGLLNPETKAPSQKQLNANMPEICPSTPESGDEW